MKTCIVELTNRCNLRCGHCYAERHAATGDLGIEVIERLAREGHVNGVRHFSFTGGEPTLHRQFDRVTEIISDAGYSFSLVTNGSTFPAAASMLHSRVGFTGVTFSLDGATEGTHDALRGQGSFRRVMRAASACVGRGIAFTFNMVITAKNRHEVEDLVASAHALGASGVRFGELMFDPRALEGELGLSAPERRAVEGKIRELAGSAPITVGIAPGYYSASPFFPCAPLELREFNVDYQGNVTLCCHLSGHAGPRPDADKMGNLAEVTLGDALAEFRRRVARYLADKRAVVERGEFDVLDHFPCWYCAKYLGKASSHAFPAVTLAPSTLNRRFRDAQAHN